MPYELALELKNAGFPQRGMGIRLDDGEVVAYVPLLEELVEACGNSFESLNKKGNVWDAWGTYYCCDEHGEGKKIEDGPTPIIAVAKLWLALNKK